jgi:6-phosphogluconolactonase
MVLAGCGGNGSIAAPPGSGSGTGSSGTGSGSGGSGGGSGGSGGGGSGGGSGSGNEFLYATAYAGGGTLYAWQIDSSTGLLTPVAGQPFLADVGSGNSQPCTEGCSTNLAADPKGRFLFLAYNLFTGGLDSLSVDPTTGALTSVANVSQTVGSIAVDPSGQYLYGNPETALTAGGTIDLYGYTIAGNGNLSAVPGSPYTLSSAQEPSTISHGPPAVSSSDVFVSLDYQSVSTMQAFHIAASSGSLTADALPGGAQAAGAPAVTPSGQFVYAAGPVYPSGGSLQYQIVPYSVGADGTVTTSSTPAAITPETSPFGLLMSPNGNFLYAFGDKAIYDYEVNQSTGALTKVAAYTGTVSFTAAIDPATKYLYLVPNSGSPDYISGDTIVGYSINSSSGSLTEISGSAVTLPQSAISLAVVRSQ